MASIAGMCMLAILASYDIACQYFVNFFARVLGLPEELRIQVPVITPKVPKGHIVAHGESCQSKYSFNFARGVGRTDGEGIERLWSWLNKAAPSTKEMTPSGRRETLDDFCGYTNWKKTLGLGKIVLVFSWTAPDLIKSGDSLLRKIVEALREADDHIQEFTAFEATIRSAYPKEVEEWEAMVTEWDMDSSKPCPYFCDKSSTSHT